MKYRQKIRVRSYRSKVCSEIWDHWEWPGALWDLQRLCTKSNEFWWFLLRSTKKLRREIKVHLSPCLYSSLEKHFCEWPKEEKRRKKKLKSQKISIHCSHLPRSENVPFPALPKWNQGYSSIGPGMTISNTNQESPSGFSAQGEGKQIEAWLCKAVPDTFQWVLPNPCDKVYLEISANYCTI